MEALKPQTCLCTLSLSTLWLCSLFCSVISGEQIMEGDHALVKGVAKKHYSPALVSIHLRAQFLEQELEKDPQAPGQDGGWFAKFA